MCRNMRDLGLMQGATPLLDNTSASSTSAQEGFQVAYGWDSPAGTAAWDSRSVFGCVCDAPWEVSEGRMTGGGGYGEGIHSGE